MVLLLHENKRYHIYWKILTKRQNLEKIFSKCHTSPKKKHSALKKSAEISDIMKCELRQSEISLWENARQRHDHKHAHNFLRYTREAGETSASEYPFVSRINPTVTSKGAL